MGRQHEAQPSEWFGSWPVPGMPVGIRQAQAMGANDAGPSVMEGWLYCGA